MTKSNQKCDSKCDSNCDSFEKNRFLKAIKINMIAINGRDPLVPTIKQRACPCGGLFVLLSWSDGIWSSEKGGLKTNGRQTGVCRCEATVQFRRSQSYSPDQTEKPYPCGEVLLFFNLLNCTRLPIKNTYRRKSFIMLFISFFAWL